jgi:hypothetical protein
MVECSFKTHTKVTTMATNGLPSTSNKLPPHPYYVKRRVLRDDDESDKDVERWYPEGWWGAQDDFHGHEEESEDESSCVDDDDRAFGGRRRFSDAKEDSEDEDEDERNGYGWGEQEPQEQEQKEVPVAVEVPTKPHYTTYRIESWHWYQRTAPSTEHTIEHYNASCERRAHWVEPHVMFLRDNVTKVKGFYFYGNGFPMENLADTDGYVDVRTGKKYASSQALFEAIK